MSRGASVRVTANFERNLEDIRCYLEEHAARGVFDALLTQIFDTIIPNFESFPDLGADFLARRPASVEGRSQVVALQRKIRDAASIREYITGDYLLLYAVLQGRIYLLSIRHHRQISFDLRLHWAR